ncbi:hypothetical protein K438DRAFT_967572 [Mycena galopus ATCC 62051]|nr:hypothetical protein K438DRAFT_967572 [Mycena galopus ATCC 62051]
MDVDVSMIVLDRTVSWLRVSLRKVFGHSFSYSTKHATMKYNGKTTTATIVDSCPGCPSPDGLDPSSRSSQTSPWASSTATGAGAAVVIRRPAPPSKRPRLRTRPP